jgi:glutathione S-transferase
LYGLCGYLPSGNGCKCRLVLKQLGIPYELVQMDIEAGAARTPAFLAGGAYSLADIALYAYTHVAPEGGFSLDSYRNILAWIARVEQQPHWAPITAA